MDVHVMTQQTIWDDRIQRFLCVSIKYWLSGWFYIRGNTGEFKIYKIFDIVAVGFVTPQNGGLYWSAKLLSHRK